MIWRMHPDDVPPIIDTVRSTPGADPRERPDPAGDLAAFVSSIELDDGLPPGTFRVEAWQQRVVDGFYVQDETHRHRPAQHFRGGGRVQGRTFSMSTADERPTWDAEATCIELPPAPIATPGPAGAPVDDLRGARLDRFVRPDHLRFLG